ncbi:pseudaminic acid synthase [Stygiobacter electus]|uniref:Pseudaminic acid synthase n=1 Tax=Stygiobacter electus TaxID=3032292 RepID=A0AAE3TE03_9BACT|nr:pseudaminic acid synthase [Stygiobacter electus]MDF1611972.1 pseudaminic acid synthase [Stygiobacter electus]
MKIQIGDKFIGDDEKTFIIAELSANHNQKFDIAIQSIKAIKECGADAVKLQTYTPDTITINSDKEYFQIKQGTIWDGTTLYELYKQAFTPWDWQPKLKEYAESLGLICFSSPFDKTAVDFLEGLNVPAYKVASFEITDLPLIEYIAKKNKPIIISTGIATLEEIDEVVKICKDAGNDKIILLKCTSEYPAPIEDANLSAIKFLNDKYNVIAGLSDHTLGIDVPIASVALGAKVIEKHFILDRNIGGPDSSFSLEPNEFKQMVESIRNVEKAIGKPKFELSEKILKSRKFARSLFVVENIEQGEIFTEQNVRSIRPNYGLAPKYLKDVLGRKAKTKIEKGTPLSWDLIEQ